MSTLAYADLTNKREAAQPDTSTTSGQPGMRTYIDAFAALVPAEVLTLHGLILTATTHIDQGVASIPPEAKFTLAASFWALMALCLALYAIPRGFGGHWDRYDFLRMMIAPLAFLGWTMLQPATAFDAAFPRVGKVPRTVIALFLGAILGAVTAALALKADQKPAPPP